MEVKTIVTGVFLTVGCFFIVVAAIGVVRFPDFYTRMHPAGKGDTLGQAIIIMGLVIYEGFSLVTVKLVLLMGLIFLVNPAATHFMAKAAYLAGVKPLEGTKDMEVKPSKVVLPPYDSKTREVEGSK